MNWLSEFWSKGRNRAFVYTFGFLIILGSYVIGAPENRGPAVAKASKKTKLSASTSPKSEVQELNLIPTPQTQTIAQPKITPTTTVISASNTPTIDPPHVVEQDPTPIFPYPVNKMKASNDVKKKIVERLLEGPKEYPYVVVDNEEGEQKLEKLESKAWDVSGSRAQKKDKKESNDKKTADTKNDSKSNGPSSSKTPTTYVNNSASVSKTNKSNNSGKVDESNESKGDDYSNDGSGEEYDSSVHNPTPTWLANNYSYVHVYSFKKGAGGSLKFPSFNLDLEAEYAGIRSVIFSPPDWQLGWEKFIKTSLKDAIITHLLPLGINGSITFQIQGGYISNQPGADFLIVENPFCSLVRNGKSEIVESSASTLLQMNSAVCFPEPAKVEVAENPQGPFYAFTPCDGQSVDGSTACAGVVPQIYKPGMDLKNSGGDLFDISSLKNAPKSLKVHYIRITDLNNESGEVGSQGFDLDSFVPFAIVSEQVVSLK